MYIMFTAAFGFMFGQLFFGSFDWYATAAGVFGLFAAVTSFYFSATDRKIAIVVFVLCVMAIFGVGMDAYDYYQNYDIPGNYYAWALIAPYCGCLVYLAVFHFWNSRNSE